MANLVKAGYSRAEPVSKSAISRLIGFLDFTLRNEEHLDEEFLRTAFEEVIAWVTEQSGLNIPADQLELRLMPANGGVVHVNFIWQFVSPKYPEWQEKGTAALKDLHAHLDTDEAIAKGIAGWEKINAPPRGGISEVADHIDHIRKGAGVNHIGVGADFFDVTPGSMVVGLEDVTRYPYLFAELLRRGYSDEDVFKIAGRNHLRAMRQMEKVATELQKSEVPLITEGLKVK